MNEEQIEQLKQLIKHPGWKIIATHLQANLDWCTKKALDPNDETMKESITMAKRELVIKWRSYNELLLNMPDAILNSVKVGEPIEAPTKFDPYFEAKDLQ